MSFMTDNETLFRYFHILSGITWIGLLYFFNLVNLPLLKFNMKKPFDVDMTEKATANITLKTLFWFRWGAMFTFIFGILLIGARAESLGGFDTYFFGRGFAGWSILVGVIFGTIMWANVWFIIWPAQQKILTNNKAIAAGAENKDSLGAENAPLIKNAVLASRANTWLSIPMLFGMVFGAHGSGLTWGSASGPLIVMAVVIALMVLYSTQKKA
jgi:uncharacterized membrane protein